MVRKTDEEFKDVTYIFLIALLMQCPLEKAKALYEGRKVWVSPSLVDEMAAMRKEGMKLQEIAELYGLKRQQVGEFLQQHKEREAKKEKRDEDSETGDDGKTDAGQGGVAEGSEQRDRRH